MVLFGYTNRILFIRSVLRRSVARLLRNLATPQLRTSLLRRTISPPLENMTPGVCFMGRVRPLWFIERSSRRWGAVPPRVVFYGARAPPLVYRT